jgi:hypothetical protein
MIPKKFNIHTPYKRKVSKIVIEPHFLARYPDSHAMREMIFKSREHKETES